MSASELYRLRLCAGLLLFGVAGQLEAQTDQTIYNDSLQIPWANWGWATLNYNNTTPVHSGSKSISVTFTDNSAQGIYLHHDAFDSSGYTNLTFWIHGGASGGQQLLVQGHAGGAAQTKVNLAALPPNTWQKITVSLSALGVANRLDMDGFWIQDRVGAIQPTFYLDDLVLVASTAPPVTNTSVSITVDAQMNQHPISPLIYGVAFATSNQLSDLNSPLHRSGGNGETRYNWQINAHNHANDWFFESLADSPATAGAAADSFVADSKNGGAQPMLTVSMIGWAPKLGPSRGRLASYSIAKYGVETGNDSQWFADAGNGITATNSKPITWNDPNDANFPTNSVFQQAWLQHVTNRWGLSTNGGVPYYLMDNEHSIWHSTHRDVHPAGATMEEIRDRIFDYAGVVKALDPNALILGPEEWGWLGYIYSGADQQYGSAHGWSSFPDRAAHGNLDYLPWLLGQLHTRATNTNQRLLDFFTVHIYPQGGESGDDVSVGTQLLRNRSTRSLWDPSYVDTSWINSVVKLIPRLSNWVANYYPGTKIGITEYNWGAENHINGATAQADIFGIFGREGLHLATRWTTPVTGTPTYKAMKMYRNYDGNHSGFGDTSVSVTGPNPDNVASFAALRSTDGALTLMVINKQLSASATASINLAHFLAAGTGRVWQLTSANAITRLTDIAFTGAAFTNTVPPQSITLFVVPAGIPIAPHLRLGTNNTANTFNFWLDGQAGQRYRILAAPDLATWTSIQTNTLTGASTNLTFSTVGTSYRFYRAEWLP